MNGSSVLCTTQVHLSARSTCHPTAHVLHVTAPTQNLQGFGVGLSAPSTAVRACCGGRCGGGGGLVVVDLLAEATAQELGRLRAQRSPATPGVRRRGRAMPPRSIRTGGICKFTRGQSNRSPSFSGEIHPSGPVRCIWACSMHIPTMDSTSLYRTSNLYIIYDLY